MLKKFGRSSRLLEGNHDYPSLSTFARYLILSRSYAPALERIFLRSGVSACAPPGGGAHPTVILPRSHAPAWESISLDFGVKMRETGPTICIPTLERRNKRIEEEVK